jgi:hypothetical protein
MTLGEHPPKQPFQEKDGLDLIDIGMGGPRGRYLSNSLLEMQKGFKLIGVGPKPISCFDGKK